MLCRLEIDMKDGLIALAAVCLLIPGLLLAQPAVKKTIVGVWEVKTVPAGQSASPFLSLAIYGSDGSFTTCGGYKALVRFSIQRRHYEVCVA